MQKDLRCECENLAIKKNLKMVFPIIMSSKMEKTLGDFNIQLEIRNMLL